MAMKQQTAREWLEEKHQRAFALTEGIPFWNTLLRDGEFRFDDKSLSRIIAARELLLLEIRRAKVVPAISKVTSNVIEVNFHEITTLDGS